MVCGWNENGDRVDELILWKENEIKPWKASAHAELDKLKSWKNSADPELNKLNYWKDNEFTSWKTETDSKLASLGGSQKKLFDWQQELDKWKATTTAQLGELDKKKLGVDDYTREQIDRDKQINALAAAVTSAIPPLQAGMGQMEGKVAKLGGRTDEIEEAVHRRKKDVKKIRRGGCGGRGGDGWRGGIGGNGGSGGSDWSEYGNAQSVNAVQHGFINMIHQQQQLGLAIPLGGFYPLPPPPPSPSPPRRTCGCAPGCRYNPVHVGLRWKSSSGKKW